MTDDVPVAGGGAARRLRVELFDDQALDRLICRTGDDGVTLTGEDGFLPELLKAVLERGLNALN